MNKKLALEVTGNDGSKYIFIVRDDPQYLPEWQANGIDITEVVKLIPAGQEVQHEQACLCPQKEVHQ